MVASRGKSALRVAKIATSGASGGRRNAIQSRPNDAETRPQKNLEIRASMYH